MTATTPEPVFDEGAFDILKKNVESYGLVWDAELDALFRGAMINYGNTLTAEQVISLIMPDLQKTKAFNNRFPGWAQRVQNGYNQLNVGEYLQLENQYHRIMQEAGLPKGFYDDPNDYGNWIASNVSPDEIQGRVGLAVRAAQQVDPTMRDLMARFYGLTTGDVASYFLDQSRALPVIQRQYETAGVASWAQRNGFNVTGMSRYEDLVDKGVTADQAAGAYGTIKSLSDTVGQIAGIYGDSYSQTDAENDVFFNQSDKRRRLVSQEAATFGGSSQGATGSAKRQSY